MTLHLFTAVQLLKLTCLIPSFDAAQSGQMNFQRPATQTMSYLVDLHHDIFAILLFLCVLVFYWLIQAANKFRSTNKFTLRDFQFTAHTGLEVV
jgi:heme/copper-type cytochrome/quinol oxidase subunit 2